MVVAASGRTERLYRGDLTLSPVRSSLPNGKLAAGSWRACGKLGDGRCSKRESLAVVDKVPPPTVCFASPVCGGMLSWRINVKAGGMRISGIGREFADGVGGT